ncbi:NrfD/PsrC family molybdoenzyme membrane anchor subunit [Acidianus sp. RZ1]|uniref:NrfD/PsrC family molybdoenzyme membrane anchor subunit n=1 Tax=Acidianus sp. RZ1 TaxID=1540082 RepID=UPI00149268F6|nr:NrfD/PsrC family molybdoenzyme membrane anchor subunit [Acidianus sp. RZ1]NON63103.1 polysulfide reductase NrfD [Acidianus sp. RZ1]
MSLYTAPAPNTPYGIQTPLLQINQYPLWSGYVELALYFTELAGMLMVIIALLEVAKFKSITKSGSIATFIASVLALGFFAADLGRPEEGIFAPIRAIQFFPYSWMARGVIFVSGLLLFSFIYMVMKILNKGGRITTLVVAILGLFAGIFSTTYSGFELAATTGVPFWNNGAIPLLYLSDGVFVATALAYILAFFIKSEEGARVRFLMVRLQFYSSIAVLSSWFLFMATVNYLYVFNQVAFYYMLSTSSFALDIGLTGIVVVLSGFSTMPTFGFLMKGVQIGGIMDLPSTIKYIMLATAIIALIAGFLTRADILLAGQYAYQLAPMTPFQLTNSQPVPIGAFGWRG